ncbi:hypothetical protein GYA54_00845 [Candidatus Kuenenbacteria bacterium]|nr:hypothetical protein [Candidatus Kuenenbacteria bacterium]
MLIDFIFNGVEDLLETLKEHRAELFGFGLGLVTLFFLAQARWEGLGEAFLWAIDFMAD